MKIQSVALMLAAAFAEPLWAQDLLEVWHAVQQHDHTLAAARAEYAATQTRREQADALGRPRIDFGLTAGVGNAQQRMEEAQFAAPGMGTHEGVNFATSVDAGLLTRAAVTAQQPLINPANSAAQEQLRLSADAGAIAWRDAQTQAMLRTAQRYFDLALAQETLRVTQQRAQTLSRAAEEAKARFDAGEAPITEVHEADALAAAAQAEIAAANLRLSTAQQTLAESSGLSELTAELPPPDDAPLPPLAEFLTAAEADNLQLAQAQRGVALAQQEVRRRQAGGRASLNLVAQAGLDRLSGDGDFGRGTNRHTNAMLGLQLNLPLIDGGMSRAQTAEAAQLLEKAQAQLDAARQQVRTQVHTAWLAHQAGTAQVTALQAALQVGEQCLKATELGRAVGERTLLDVLNAENARAAIALDLARARLEPVRQRLQLAALSNQLDENVLRRIGGALKNN